MTNFAEFEKANVPEEAADKAKSESAPETKEGVQEQIAKESKKLELNVALMDAGLTDLNKQAEKQTSPEAKMTREEKLKKIQESYEVEKTGINVFPIVGIAMSVFSGAMMLSQGSPEDLPGTLLMSGAITAATAGIWAFARLHEFLKFKKETKAVEKEG